MSDLYLLVAYKPDSEDYCRGCRMASYSADHILVNDLTKEELIDNLVNIFYKNKHHERFESGYDYWIFKNGIKLFGDCGSNGDDTMEIDDILKQAECKVNTMISEEIRKTNEAANEVKRKSEERAKEERLEKYKKLKEEFEKGDPK